MMFALFCPFTVYVTHSLLRSGSTLRYLYQSNACLQLSKHQLAPSCVKCGGMEVALLGLGSNPPSKGVAYDMAMVWEHVFVGGSCTPRRHYFQSSAYTKNNRTEIGCVGKCEYIYTTAKVQHRILTAIS